MLLFSFESRELGRSGGNVQHPPNGGWERAGTSSVSHSTLKVILIRNGPQHSEHQGWKGPHCFSSAPIHVPPGDTKARDRKQPAREKQLFCGRAKATTQVVLINPLGSTWCVDVACLGEARPSTSSPCDHRQLPPPLSSGCPTCIKEGSKGIWAVG